MARSQTTATATLADFEVPNRRSLESSADEMIAPIHLAAPVPVSDAVETDGSPSDRASRGQSAKIKLTAVVIGIATLSGGTAMLVVAALSAR